MRWMNCLSVLAATLILSSCSMGYGVQAVFIRGELAFITEDDDVNRESPCMRFFRIVTPEEEVVWQFTNHEAAYDACETAFPVYYGVPPDGANVVVSAQPLEEGQIYLVDGDGTHSYSGEFRIRTIRQIDNFAAS